MIRKGICLLYFHIQFKEGYGNYSMHCVKYITSVRFEFFFLLFIIVI
jgi:hypothetical protein